jgi:hypothetical protein
MWEINFTDFIECERVKRQGYAQALNLYTTHGKEKAVMKLLRSELTV